MSTPNVRIQWDLTGLLLNGFELEMLNDGLTEFFLDFHGPKNSLYEGGVWKVGVLLSDDHPFEPPFVVFGNKIFHPNFGERGGLVALRDIEEDWKPIYDLCDVIEFFLPQLLLHPNIYGSEIMNEEAEHLMITDPASYERRVKDFCWRYCESYTRPVDIEPVAEEASSSSVELSEDESDSSDEEVAGEADP